MSGFTRAVSWIQRKRPHLASRFFPELVTADSFKLYSEGISFYHQIIKDIDSARKRVWIETYVLDSSAPAKNLLARLAAAQSRGVETILCYDALGSFFRSPRNELDAYKAAGGKIAIWNPLLQSPFRVRLYRNHRKVTLVDDIAYIGSANFDAESYVKTQQRKNDVNIGCRLTGKSVISLVQDSIFHTLFRTQLPFTRHLRRWEAKSSSSKLDGVPNVKIGLLESDGIFRNRSNYGNIMEYVMSNCRQSLTIASSYFHPPRWMLKQIHGALMNGKEINLYISGGSDILFDEKATSHILSDLGSHPNLHIKSTRESHLHSKIVTADENWSILGSYNMDRISSRRNRELGVFVDDSDVTQSLNNALAQMKIWPDQKPLTKLAKLRNRISHAFVKLLGSRLMDGLRHDQRRLEKFGFVLPSESQGSSPYS